MEVHHNKIPLWGIDFIAVAVFYGILGAALALPVIRTDTHALAVVALIDAICVVVFGYIRYRCIKDVSDDALLEKGAVVAKVDPEGIVIKVAKRLWDVGNGQIVVLDIPASSDAVFQVLLPVENIFIDTALNFEITVYVTHSEYDYQEVYDVLSDSYDSVREYLEEYWVGELAGDADFVALIYRAYDSLMSSEEFVDALYVVLATMMQEGGLTQPLSNISKSYFVVQSASFVKHAVAAW